MTKEEQELKEKKEKEEADALAAKQAEKEGQIDYEAEYKTLVEKTQAGIIREEALAKERDNYKAGLLSAKAKLKGKDKDGNEVEIETSEDVNKLIEESVKKNLSSFQTSLASQNIDAAIAAKTSNPALQKLIKHHFEYSTQGEDIGERIDNALAIANKKLISKQVSEIELAQRNRSQISGGTGTGGGSAPFETQNTQWSAENLAALKAKGLDPNKVWDNYIKYYKN